MKKKIHTTFFHLGSLFLFVSTLFSSCLYQEPELTADGENGVDPTQVNIMTELKLDMQLGSQEINKTRATTEDAYCHRFVITAYDGKQVAGQQMIFEDVQPGATTFSLPISLKLHARKYQLVVWADYVKKVDKLYQLYYDHKNLERIERAGSYRGNSEYYDGFYGTTSVDLTSYRDQWNVEVPIDIQMVRPLARYDLIATDVAKFQELVKKGEIAGKTFTATVKYNYYLTTGFNVLAGKVNNPLMYVQYNKTLPDFTAETADVNVGFDYVFVNGEGSFVSLTIEITNEKGTVVARSKGIKVPYKQGYGTTVQGNFLTSNPNPGIDIDTDFDGDINVDLDKL